MLLTAIVFVPLVLAIMTAFLPAKDNQVRNFCFFGAIFQFVLSLVLIFKFDPSTPQFQLSVYAPWVPEFGISYFLAVDGISLWLVLLTTFLTPIIILSSWKSIDRKVKTFHVCVFMLCFPLLCVLHNCLLQPNMPKNSNKTWHFFVFQFWDKKTHCGSQQRKNNVLQSQSEPFACAESRFPFTNTDF